MDTVPSTSCQSQTRTFSLSDASFNFSRRFLAIRCNLLNRRRDAPEMISASQEYLSIDAGWRSNNHFIHDVSSEYFEFVTLFQHKRYAIFPRQQNFPVNDNRRRTISTPIFSSSPVQIVFPVLAAKHATVPLSVHKKTRPLTAAGVGTSAPRSFRSQAR